jgi:DNA-binding MarR family transcriptional regulator
MSCPDNFDRPNIDEGSTKVPSGDERLQIDVRLGLNEVAAAEEEQLRRNPRRQPTTRELARLAGKIYDARRSRERMFKDQLFGEPAWDMLLALYALPTRGMALGVTSLTHAANVPPTTGLRWQTILFEEGLIQRGPHVSDNRQQLVGLTEKGRMLMEKYLIRLYDLSLGSTDID